MMLNDLPLHPLIVHFPIAIGCLLPLIAIGLIWSIKKKKLPLHSWAMVSFLCAIYLATALFASEMGEEDEDRVEKIVGHDVMHEHEEAGEKVPWAAGILLGLSLIPVVLGAKFKQKDTVVVTAQGLFFVASLAGLYPIVLAGHTGGELVYKHGAAEAHVQRQQVIKDYMLKEKNEAHKKEHSEEDE